MNLQRLFHLVSHAPLERSRATLWLRLSGLGALAALILTVLAMEWTSRPQFCVTCHYMQSFYDSWAASKHAQVVCIKCHFDPGVAGTVRGKFQGLFQVFSYVTSFYKKSKPWAEISDATCLQSGCHANQDRNKAVPFKNIVFSHANHLKDIRRVAKLRCTSCHSQMVQGEHLSVTSGTCFTCHFKAGTTTRFALDSLAWCERCHTPAMITRATNPNVRFDHRMVIEKGIECHSCHGDVVQGTGDVPRQACMSCHFERERLARYDDVRFVHENHITEHKIECQNCHILIQHKLQRLNPETPPDCNSCHPNTHMEQKILFTGHGGNTRLDQPSKMYESGLNCTGCHVLHGMVNGFSVRRAGGQACESCHGAGFQRILASWDHYAASMLAEIATIDARAAALVRGAGTRAPELRAAAGQLLAQAGENIRIVRVGKGVHNLGYATSLLTSAYDRMAQALDTLRIRERLPVFSAATRSLTPGECGTCHQRMEDYQPVPAFGGEFPHAPHLQTARMTCDNCHMNQPTHGVLRITKPECTSCHHPEQPKADDGCRRCHTAQFTIYEGRLPGMTRDTMKGADVKCVDCHADPQANVTRAVGPKCIDCHSKEYAAMIATGRGEVEDLLAQVRTLVARTTGTDEIRKLVAMVQKDGSGGMHNHAGVMGALQAAARELRERPASSVPRAGADSGGRRRTARRIPGRGE